MYAVGTPILTFEERLNFGVITSHVNGYLSQSLGEEVRGDRKPRAFSKQRRNLGRRRYLKTNMYLCWYDM